MQLQASKTLTKALKYKKAQFSFWFRTIFESLEKVTSNLKQNYLMNAVGKDEGV